MKYKCDVEGCEFECEFENELIKHFETKHKDELTSYCINWMKSKGLTPIETCRVCGKRILVDKLRLVDGHRHYIYNSLLPLFTGICCSHCQENLLTSYLWRYEPCHGNNLQCLYERCNTWDKPEVDELTKPRKFRRCSLETKIKISNSVVKAITEGRLNPKFNNTSKIGGRPNKNIPEWIKLCKSKLRKGASHDEINFRKKIESITKNIGTQIYFNLGLKWRFLDYFIFYKFHKINIEIDGDQYHKISNDLIRDKLLYEKYNVLTLRINNIASRRMSINQLIDSIDDLINNGPYWNRYIDETDIYDWKWLVHYGYYKSCKAVLTSS